MIQVPPDGAGKQVETNTPDGTTHRQVVTVGDKTTAANVLAIDASGRPTVNVNGTLSTRPTDGTNAITKTFDTDSGAGSEWNLGVSLRKTASGGSVEAGTSTDPLRVDPTGTTTQPVSGTVTVTQATASNLKVDLSGTAANATAIKVDGSAVTQPVSGTFWQATQPVSGTVTVQQSTASSLKVDLSGTAANATAIKVDGSAVTQPVSIAATISATPKSATSGGLSVFNGSVAGTATAVKASAGQIYGYHILNTTAAIAYVQVFNVAQGSVTVGTTAPTYVLGIPASGGAVFSNDLGIAHGTAITIACTTTRSGSTGATCEVTIYYA